MQIRNFFFFVLLLALHLSVSISSAQVSEPMDQVLEETLSKFKLNLRLIFDRSIIRDSSAHHVVLQSTVGSNSCIQPMQTISISQQKNESTFVQSLIFIDCNNNKSVISITQPATLPVEITFRDWLNGNWKFSEMRTWRLQLSHRKLFIEKRNIERDEENWTQVHIDYADVPDPDIPTDTARLNFAEFKSESHLTRNYSIDVGKISPMIHLRFQNTLNSTGDSKDIFSQSLYYDQTGEISPKTFASQYQSYLANIIFKSVHSALGTIPLVLPSL